MATNPNIIRDTKVRPEEFLLSEAGGERSRDNAVVAPHVAAIGAGTVMGRLTSNGQLVAYSNAATDGSQTAVGIARNYLPPSTVAVETAILSRDCEVDGFFITGADAAALVDLTALGVIVR